MTMAMDYRKDRRKARRLLNNKIDKLEHDEIINELRKYGINWGDKTRTEALRELLRDHINY